MNQREIKFRAWDKEFEKFWQWEEITINSTGVYYPQGYKSFNSGLIELVEFTGLKDKNGKEIYEGDIVIKESVWHKKPSEVKWSKYNNGWNFRESIKDKLEVIGNIYENPKLLK